MAYPLPYPRLMILNNHVHFWPEIAAPNGHSLASVRALGVSLVNLAWNLQLLAACVFRRETHGRHTPNTRKKHTETHRKTRENTPNTRIFFGGGRPAMFSTQNSAFRIHNSRLRRASVGRRDFVVRRGGEQSAYPQRSVLCSTTKLGSKRSLHQPRE